MLYSFKGHLKSYFIAGLALCLPIIITLSIFVYFVNLLTAPFSAFLIAFLSIFFSNLDLSFFFISHEQMISLISKIFLIAILITLISLLGWMTRYYFLEKILNGLDYLLRRIPLINRIYTGIQQFIKTFFRQDNKLYRQVVTVGGSHSHNTCLGLAIGESLKCCETAVGYPLVAVLIPTSPIPITGYIIMVKPEHVTKIDMSVEEAIKYIVSCGLLGKKN